MIIPFQQLEKIAQQENKTQVLYEENNRNKDNLLPLLVFSGVY